MAERSDGRLAAGAAARVGELWTEEEHHHLVAELSAGLTLEAIAAAHGRTVRAIEKRASLLVPAEGDYPTTGAQRVLGLRERLMAGGYDWRTPLIRALAPGQRLWSEADHLQLRLAWQQRTPLPALAQLFELPEILIVRALVRLGLATGVVEVTDRLGCTPGGLVAVRRQLALDSAAATVHVLVITVGAEVLHVSVHPTVQDARAAADDARQAQDPHTPVGVGVTIASRLVGGGSDGRTRTTQHAFGTLPGVGSRPLRLN